MYLKLTKHIKLLEIGKLLSPDADEMDLDWDYENVYEWMYVDLPEIDFSLNISREHGMADMTEEELDEIDDDPKELEKRLKPGSTYIFGWNKANDCYVHDIPDSIIVQIANKLRCDVLIYPGRSNADEQDPEPIGCISPEAQQIICR